MPCTTLRQRGGLSPAVKSSSGEGNLTETQFGCADDFQPPTGQGDREPAPSKLHSATARSATALARHVLAPATPKPSKLLWASSQGTWRMFSTSVRTSGGDVPYRLDNGPHSTSRDLADAVQVVIAWTNKFRAPAVHLRSLTGVQTTTTCS
jgi:hypothetical protein